jgi:hypothetical protein
MHIHTHGYSHVRRGIADGRNGMETNGSAGPVCLLAFQRGGRAADWVGVGSITPPPRKRGWEEGELAHKDGRTFGQSEDGVFHGDAMDAHELLSSRHDGRVVITHESCTIIHFA